MKDVPIHNDGKTQMYVGNKLIPPGETKVFAENELPPHLRPSPQPAPAPVTSDDPLLDLLDENASVVIKAIGERDEAGNPLYTTDQLIRLAEAEDNGHTRKTVMKALREEQLKRSDEQAQREELAVFAESLKEMAPAQLDELKATHQEDPAKVAAIALQQVANQVDQAVAEGDRELLQMLREDLPGDVEVPAAQALIDAALAKLDE